MLNLLKHRSEGIAFCLAVLTIAGTRPAEAFINVYVLHSGTDSGNCQTQTSPCRTINFTIKAAQIFTVSELASDPGYTGGDVQGRHRIGRHLE